MTDDVKLEGRTPENHSSEPRAGTPRNWAEFHELSHEVQAGLEQMHAAAQRIAQAWGRVRRAQA